jgi:predicted phosphohydrolase
VKKTHKKLNLEFNNHIGLLPHPFKVIIFGNRDYYENLKKEEIQKVLTNGIYLQEDLIEIDGIQIYGL